MSQSTPDLESGYFKVFMSARNKRVLTHQKKKISTMSLVDHLH